MSSSKLSVGLSMLSDCATDGEFNAAATVLTKLLTNIVAAPAEPKYRTVRAGNPKIAAMLATRGVRAILVGVGFEEQDALLTLPAGAALDGIESALAAIGAQSQQRAAGGELRKCDEAAKRKERADKENEERKRMQLGIMDDANARKEPGWTAKAAGVKGGRAITGCSDVGIGNGGGG